MVARDATTKRILVCDDERHILRLLEVNLKRQGYTVYLAADGETALRELARTPIDMLVIDATLTCPSADEVLTRMRELPNCENVQVVLMRKSDDGPPDGPPAGSPVAPAPDLPGGSKAVRVIRKPFNPEILDEFFDSN